jgi:PAS domain-containing protein
LEVNPSWLQLLGYSRPDEVLGKHPAELSAPIQPGGEIKVESETSEGTTVTVKLPTFTSASASGCD